MSERGSEQWILEYRQAYREANNTDIAPPILPRGNGWYVMTVGCANKYRRRDIEAMTARLRARIPQPTPRA